MAFFLFCLASGVWHLYNFVTYIHPEWMLPFARLAGDGSTTLRVLNMVCLNWSPIIGVILLIFGVVGLIFRQKDENNFESFKYFMVFFAALSSFGLML